MMRTFLLGIFAAYLAVALIILGGAFLYPNVPVWHQIYSTIPAFATRYTIIRAARKHVFQAASDALNRQADIAEALGMNEVMRRKLVEDSHYVMQRARLKAHFNQMAPWLGRLAALAPRNYLARLMQAEAEAVLRPETAAQVLAPVRDIAPALDRPYRYVIEESVRAKSTDILRDWCDVYRTSQFGSFDPLDFFPAKYLGQGLGFFFLEAETASGDVVLVPYEGLQLNETRAYDFEIPMAPSQDALRLHFPTLPGVSIAIRAIHFVTADGNITMGPADIYLVSRFGYIDDQDRVLIASYAGDVLSVIPRSGPFPPSDTIQFEIEFRRLPFTNHEDCRTANR